MVLEIKNKHGEFEVLYDDDKHELLKNFKWQVSVKKVNEVNVHCGYQEINGKRQFVSMGRFLLGIIGDETVECDHQNGNGLDNQMHNIRIADSQKNKHNRKSWGKIHYKGVHVGYGKYVALIKPSKDERQLGLGKFEDVIEAAKAYDSAAHHFFGEFAKLNFPDEIPEPYVEKIKEPYIPNLGISPKCQEIIESVFEIHGKVNKYLIEDYLKFNNIDLEIKNPYFKFASLLRKMELKGEVIVERRNNKIMDSVNNYFKIV